MNPRVGEIKVSSENNASVEEQKDKPTQDNESHCKKAKSDNCWRFYVKRRQGLDDGEKQDSQGPCISWR